MENEQYLSLTIEQPSQERYIPVPFDPGEGVERLDIRYSYPKQQGCPSAGGVVDFALLDPAGKLVGASGSDRDHVWISPLGSSAGFERCSIVPGRWTIIAGAYRIPSGGLTVEYSIRYTRKSRRLFKGDTHIHTTASDGSGGAEETAALAAQLGLDFIFITDHNNHAENSRLPRPDGLTVLPGCEWTHYRGHAGLLGAERPFTGFYGAEHHEQAAALLREAQDGGAFVSVNHPFCPLVPWRWGFDLPFDGIEVWNGIMSERNERAALWWQERLSAGKHIPVTGGSDYHRPGLLGSIAMPCHCLWAQSREPADIMNALRLGSGYISYMPDGPGIDILREHDGKQEACLGTETPAGTEIEFRFFSLKTGDTARLITADTTETVSCPENTPEVTLRRHYTGTPFVRAELYRSYAPGLPPMRALLSNPVYFAGGTV